ncbi:hypothetical protein FGLOB1_2942 [Fusarium globosum]|uniref:Uncharacterized protein n=1 Tax=Fusarium globosum TaxID=78864 RepID=A0A8H5YQW2_9HYPO|nr:hypothetical protein FGLOB1_2942 [Fusarium globosum]
MTHPKITGFAALKRSSQAGNQPARPVPEPKGLTFVESMTLQGVNNEKSCGLRLVNNSPGGGRQENVVAKVPGLEGTYSAIVDNPGSLVDAYKILPRGKISVIFAVTPNGSGVNMTSTEIPWSVFKAREEEAATTDNEIDQSQALDDEQTVIGDDETVVGDNENPKKGTARENNETTPEPTTTTQPASDPNALYPDLAGLIMSTIRHEERRAGSTASNRPSEERALNGGPPENQDGGERPQEIELPDSDVLQPDVPPDVQQGGPQRGSNMISFPRLEDNPDGDNPSNDAPQQASSQQASSQQANPQQANPQQANPQQGSESRTVTSQSPSCKYPRDEELDNSSSSDDAPSAIVARLKEKGGRKVSRYQKVKHHMSKEERDMIEAMSQFN